MASKQYYTYTVLILLLYFHSIEANVTISKNGREFKCTFRFNHSGEYINTIVLEATELCSTNGTDVSCQRTFSRVCQEDPRNCSFIEQWNENVEKNGTFVIHWGLLSQSFTGNICCVTTTKRPCETFEPPTTTANEPMNEVTDESPIWPIFVVLLLIIIVGIIASRFGFKFIVNAVVNYWMKGCFPISWKKDNGGNNGGSGSAGTNGSHPAQNDIGPSGQPPRDNENPSSHQAIDMDGQMQGSRENLQSAELVVEASSFHHNTNAELVLPGGLRRRLITRGNNPSYAINQTSNPPSPLVSESAAEHSLESAPDEHVLESDVFAANSSVEEELKSSFTSEESDGSGGLDQSNQRRGTQSLFSQCSSPQVEHDCIPFTWLPDQEPFLLPRVTWNDDMEAMGDSPTSNSELFHQKCYHGFNCHPVTLSGIQVSDPTCSSGDSALVTRGGVLAYQRFWESLEGSISAETSVPTQEDEAAMVFLHPHPSAFIPSSSESMCTYSGKRAWLGTPSCTKLSTIVTDNTQNHNEYHSTPKPSTNGDFEDTEELLTLPIPKLLDANQSSEVCIVQKSLFGVMSQSEMVSNGQCLKSNLLCDSTVQSNSLSKEVLSTNQVTTKTLRSAPNQQSSCAQVDSETGSYHIFRKDGFGSADDSIWKQTRGCVKGSSAAFLLSVFELKQPTVGDWLLVFFCVAHFWQLCYHLLIQYLQATLAFIHYSADTCI